MMINSPHVNIMNKYTPSYKNLSNGNFTKEKVYRSTMNMFDYFSDKKKEAFYMLDYFSGKIGKDEEMNIIFEDGKYATQEQIEKRKHQYAKYIENSNIYKLVISFPSNYLESNVNIKKFEFELATKIIPMFLKKCHFKDISKMSYQFSLHTNTDNLHFHLSFAEKKPNYIDKHGNIAYRTKGKLTQEELNFLKNEIEHYISKDKLYTNLLTETNKQIDELKKYFNPNDKNYLLKNKDSILLEYKIYKLGELVDNIREGKKVKYNSIKNKEIIKLTKQIKKELFQIDSFKNDYQFFLSNISKINDYFDSLSKNNHSSIKNHILTDNKVKYLDNYVCNAIINQSLNKYRVKIKEEDIIREIIYKEYKRNGINNKYKNLVSYLKNRKYRNRGKVRLAVKSINDELEEAEKEFDKLFKIDKEYS